MVAVQPRGLQTTSTLGLSLLKFDFRPMAGVSRKGYAWSMIPIKGNRGQGTTEYIVILALAILFFVGVFWKRIGFDLTTKTDYTIQAIHDAGR
jgi:hypothetical protein